MWRTAAKNMLQSHLDFGLGSDVSNNKEECSTVPLLEECGGKLLLRKEVLQKLLDPAVLKDMPIAVVSIAGAFRLGKSFLMNLLLRYFEKQGWNDKKKGGWLRDWNSSQDNGIEWRGGAKGHTKGIVAWGKPIIVRRKDGTKIAVILLDTQGNFEHGGEKEKNVGAFALSTLFSSLQIFNVSKQIQTNDLEYLQCFAEFSKVSKPETESDSDSADRDNLKKHLFQDLVFLVRDWHSPIDYRYGHIGGNKYLSDIMSHLREESEASVNRYLYNAFTQLSCFLMPEPGAKVRISDVDRPLLRSSDLGDKFFDQVTNLADKYFHPDRIPTKSIGFVENATAEHLIHYMEKCAEGILVGNFPNFPTIMQGVTEYANGIAIEKAEQHFKERLETELDELNESTWEAFDDAVTTAKKRSVEWFLQNTRYGLEKQRDQEKNRLIGLLENTKAALEVKMCGKRERYFRIVVDEWLEKSTSKLKNYREYMCTEVQVLQNIKSDCIRTLARKDPRDSSLIADILKEGEEKLEVACNDNIREVESRSSTVEVDNRGVVARDESGSEIDPPALSNGIKEDQKCHTL